MNADRKPDECRHEGAGCPRSSCLQLFVDGELEPTPASELEAHLAGCPACTERASLLAATKVSLRRQCGVRAPDALRARICLSVARESATRDARDQEGGVAAEFGAALGPSRESLAHDVATGARGEAADRRRGSSRAAVGVGALALAAGMALAVVGERAGDGVGGLAGGGDEATGDEVAASGSAAEVDRADAAGIGVAGVTTPPGIAPDGTVPRGSGLQGSGLQGSGLQGSGPHGASARGARPGRLVPLAPQPTLVGLDTPSLSPSAIAGRPIERTTIDAVLDDLVAEHMNPLPPEERNENRLSRFERTVGVAMRVPHLRKYDARFRGARVLPIRGAQRTAMLTYDLPDGERVTVYLWNPQAVPIGATRLQPRYMREAREARGGSDDPADRAPIYVGQARGYSIAACERRGVGYALATKRDAEESVRMVAASVP